MRFVHIADLQIGAQRKLPGSLERQMLALDEIVEVARRETVEAILLAGDIFEHPHPHQQEKDALLAWFDRVDKLEIPVLVMPGNHDYLNRELNGYHTLKTLQIVEGRFHHLRVFDTLAVEEFETFVLVVIPPYGGPERFQPRNWPGFHPEKIEKPIILMLHETFQGAAYRGMPADKGLDPRILDKLDVDYVAAGDIHKRQRIKCETPAYYSGSLVQKDFGEAYEDSGGILVTIMSQGVKTRPILLEKPYRLAAATVQADEVKGAVQTCVPRTILKLTVSDTPAELRALDIPALRASAAKREVTLLVEKRFVESSQPGKVEIQGAVLSQLGKSPEEELIAFLASRKDWSVPVDDLKEQCLALIRETARAI